MNITRQDAIDRIDKMGSARAYFDFGRLQTGNYAGKVSRDGDHIYLNGPDCFRFWDNDHVAWSLDEKDGAVRAEWDDRGPRHCEFVPESV